MRLVGPAVAAWVAAALALGAPGGWTAAAVALCTAGALALLLTARRRRPAGPTPGRPNGSAERTQADPPGPVAPGGGRRRTGRTTTGWLRAPWWRQNATAAAAVLLCAAAGAASAGLHGADLRQGPLPELAGRHARVTVEATVTSDPRLTRPVMDGPRTGPPGVMLDIEVTRVETATGTRPPTRVRTPVLVMTFTAQQRWRPLLPSTRLRLSGRLEPPGEQGGRYAAVLRPDAAGPVVTGAPTRLQRAAGELRAGLRDATDQLPPDARALLPGLVVGDTSRIPDDLHHAFEATDLLHLLAVSGSNLTLVLLLLIGPPGRALRAERGGLAPRLGITLRGTALLGGLLTLAFVIVCRPEPSVLRAAACGLITLLAIATGRRRSLLPALAAAVLLLVLWNPWLARGYGFLLSVLATGALLTLAPRWSAALRKRGVPGRLAETLAAAAAAQAVCAPVVVVFAGRMSLVAIPCNLLAELAVAPATVLGFATLATAPVSEALAGWVAVCAGWPAGWIASVARAGAALPGAEAAWPGGWGGGLLLALVTLLAVVAIRRMRRRVWAVSACVILLLLAVLRPPPVVRLLTGWPPPGWVAALCDVGQGDALVLAAGPGQALVVDAGPDPRLVDRCLTELGVHRVPFLVLTHFHADHVRGLPGVLDGRQVGAIQTTGLRQPPEQAEFVHRTAAAAGVPVVRAVAGERRRLGPLDWHVLWPLPSPPPPSWDPSSPGPDPDLEPNDSSVTLLVRTAGGLSLLLLGDLEPPAQQALLRAHPRLPPVDVLKVAHHGSAHQDPGLLERARPRLALVSAGRDNSYGHPAPRTMAALGAGGAAVLSTSDHGAIAVTTVGRGLRAVPRGPTAPP
ncbi:ComEC/Rec2 family competence protein [Streptomyces sp. NPDC047097]|uniref:ComEC/Rec2 family competence protein n=1 Tax=Streptomyces sp. NPDC047097 TaxID=3155260 RepID=UPI0033CA9BCB